ncbi:Integrase catalytic core [Trinorchestia longiramus]|nr:Integrase catalytic core [Trinorchestia longiramus]
MRLGYQPKNGPNDSFLLPHSSPLWNPPPAHDHSLIREGYTFQYDGLSYLDHCHWLGNLRWASPHLWDRCEIAVQARPFMGQDKLWDIVQGTETISSTVDEAARMKFESRRDLALATIVLGVDQSQLYLLGDPTDPVEVWRKLQNTFQKKSWANKFRLKKKLFNMKMEKGQNLQDHLKVFVELFEVLVIISDAMEEEERVIILLSSLLDRFSTLVTTLEAHEKIPAWEVVTERLLNKERRQYTWMYIIKNKSDIFVVFTEFKALVENHYDHKIKILGTDNGGEYVSTDFKRFLKVNGIVHQKTVPKTPEENGVAERMNRTILEAVRAMLSDSKLPKTFWAVAVSTAVYVKNRSPTSAHKNLTPYQALNGHKPNVQHLRTFGCMAYAHVPKDEREKLDSKSKTCGLLGYGRGTKGFRLYNFNAKRILLSIDVIFNESQFMSFEKEPSKEIECVPCSLPQEEKHEDSEEELELRRSIRSRPAPDRFAEWVCFAQDKFDIPANVEEALHGPESKLWKAAIEEEMASMNINNVWSLAQCPKNKKPIRCKWIFKKKTGPDGNVCSYKARLVAQGYAQKFGVDYDETFSPVVRFESVRAVLALAAKHNLQLHHMDVATALLNGELSEEIYLTQPEGFVSEGNENRVCKLNKSLYGLKQSSKCWNTALDGHLNQLGFKQFKTDAYIYTHVSNKGLCIIVVYVDDIIIESDCIDEINKVKSCLSGKYKMKDLGKLSYFLGVSVMQTKNEVFLEQSASTKALLSRFGMDNANSVATPLDVNADLVTTSDEVDECDKDLYQSAVGSFLYLSTRTRPDITQTCVGLSTAEAEYVALAGAAKEAIWLKHLIDDLEFKTGGPMIVNEDN